METVGVLANDAAAHQRWATLVTQMCAMLGWPAAKPVCKVCANTTILAIHAPTDLLLLATDINEWAWEVALSALGEVGADGPYANFQAMHSAIASFSSALAHFQARATSEHKPNMMALLQAAQQRQIPVLQDDSHFTLGTGSKAHTWPLEALPALPALPAPATWQTTLPWQAIGSIPALLVSGTNGKTTSVRLLAAIAKHAGKRTGYCCTEGVFADGAELNRGDYAGPAGARTVLRQPSIDFAVLEMARGGILRRGLALDSAQVALITNISPEHFGEYGVDNIEDLADVKLVLAQTLGTHGTLVLNADDPILRARAASLQCTLAWFAQNYAHPTLAAHRAAGGACCGVENGHLYLFIHQHKHDLGAVTNMPLTMYGSATYNIANCAGAAVSAAACGFAPAHIASVLAQFGRSRFDNPGRLERWHLSALTVLLDYAHNPEGLSGLLTVAKAAVAAQAHPTGRIGLLLGQAGNRSNDAIGELAQAAARFKPARIILKDIPGYMRGREPGEIPAMLHKQLRKSGIPAQHIDTILPEVDAACALLHWAKAGDVLVLPVHDTQAKKQMQTLLDTLQDKGWCPGQALPTALLAARSPANETNPGPDSQADSQADAQADSQAGFQPNSNT